jgi:ATP phosphoribosyltransferase
VSKIKLGLPKGSLQEATFDLFRCAGMGLSVGKRSYFPTCADPDVEVVLFRAQEISRYVADGVLDAGLTGADWIIENESDVQEVCELVYSRQTMQPARWVLAVPEDSKVQSIKDLEGKVIATELVKTTQKYLKDRGVKAKVEFSWGATEAKAELVAGIVDITETGSSLRANRLRIVETLVVSTPKLIANKKAWKDAGKKLKLENIALLLKGAIAAREKVGIKLNVSKADLEKVLKVLPALKRPTVSPLSGGGEPWFAVEAMIDEKTVRELIPELKRAGAQGIIEYPLNKVIE